MRANGRAPTPLIPPTSWMTRENVSKGMPSFPFLRVCHCHLQQGYQHNYFDHVWFDWNILVYFSIPLSGSRACPGEGLARMELFLFITSLLQRFRFSPPPGVTEDDLDLTPAVGFTLNPSPHQLCAVSRVWGERLRQSQRHTFHPSTATPILLSYTHFRNVEKWVILNIMVCWLQKQVCS